MLRNRSRWISVSLCLSLLFVLAACGGAPASQPQAPAPASQPQAQAPAAPSQAPAAQPQAPAAPAEPMKVRLTTGPDPVYSPWYVAQELGIFAKHNLETTLTQFPTGNLGIEAIVAGEADVGGTTPQSPLALNQQGAGFVTLGLHTMAPTTLKVVVNSEITTPSQLAGRKVGTIRGAVTEFVWLKFLDFHGLSTQEVGLVMVPPPEMVATMVRGDIDGFVMWEPFPSLALQAMGNKAHILATSSDNDIYSAMLHIVVKGEWADNNPETVKAMLRALAEANQYIADNPQAAAEIVARWTKWEPAAVLELMVESDYRLRFDQQTVADWREQARWYVDNNILTQEPDFDALFRPEFLKEVDPSAVGL